jgi:hypothetical protein
MYGVGRGGPGRARHASADRGRWSIELARALMARADESWDEAWAGGMLRSFSPLFLVLQLGQVADLILAAAG